MSVHTFVTNQHSILRIWHEFGRTHQFPKMDSRTHHFWGNSINIGQWNGVVCCFQKNFEPINWNYAPVLSVLKAHSPAHSHGVVCDNAPREYPGSGFFQVYSNIILGPRQKWHWKRRPALKMPKLEAFIVQHEFLWLKLSTFMPRMCHIFGIMKTGPL